MVGEPTSNLAQPFWVNGVNYWANSGVGTMNNNETDITAPVPPYAVAPVVPLWSGVVTTVGSMHCGTSVVTVSPLTQYTLSIWFRQSKAGCSSPYMRTNVGNANVGQMTYLGGTDSTYWPVNQWIRITGTVTTLAGENGLYISNYIGTTVGDKIWYWGFQLEQKSYATALVNGTRSSSQAVLDLSKHQPQWLMPTVTVVGSPTWNSNNIGFSNINSAYLDVTPATNFRVGNGDFTINAWMKFLDSGDNVIVEARGGSLVGFVYFRSSGGYLGIYLNYGGVQYTYGSTLSTIPTGSVINITVVVSKSTLTIDFYLNGSPYGATVPISSREPISPASGDQYRLGYDAGGSTQNQEYYAYQHYNRALRPDEVKQNFVALRGRFGV